MILRVAQTLPDGVEWTLIDLGREAHVAWEVSAGLSQIQIREYTKDTDGRIVSTHIRSIPCYAAWVGNEADWIPIPSEQSIYASRSRVPYRA